MENRQLTITLGFPFLIRQENSEAYPVQGMCLFPFLPALYHH